MRKFPTLPLNSNGVWIDPTGGVWQKATAAAGKEHIADYAQIAANSAAGSAAAGGGGGGGTTTGVAAASGHGDYER